MMEEMNFSDMLPPHPQSAEQQGPGVFMGVMEPHLGWTSQFQRVKRYGPGEQREGEHRFQARWAVHYTTLAPN